MSNAALNYIIQANTICFDRFCFFEIMTIIHVFLRVLGRPAFDPLNGWVLNF